MGGVWAKFYSQRQIKVLLLGLDAAGKTTMLYRLKLGEVVTSIPTIGFNVETVTADNVSMISWDIGSRDKIRPLWRHYMNGMHGIIYVVDSSDHERLEESREELHRILQDDDDGVPLLVVANKQDLRDHMSVNHIFEKMGLHALRDRQVYICAAVATTGEGVHEGLSWLADTMARGEAGKDADNFKHLLTDDHSNLTARGVEKIRSFMETLKSVRFHKPAFLAFGSSKHAS